jgi:hypothetical protein
METKELEDFLRYIHDFHTDEYGHLQVCVKGDQYDPTISKVVEQYIEYCKLK